MSSTSGNVTLDQSGAGLLKFTSNIGGADANTGNKTFILQGSTTGTGEISGNILDPAVTGNLAVTKTGTGTWTLSGNNTYTGLTTVSGGVLDVGVISSNAISNSSGIFLSGGGILQGSGTFTRSSSGTATPGADQYGSADGGFAARGGQLTVTFSNNSSTELSMNAGGFRFGTNFAFGSTSADNKVVLTNNIDLNSAGQRVFTVTAGVGGASATSAELSGVIRNTNATPGGITKRGDGMLILANTNSSYGGATTVENGILSIASIKNVGGGNSSLGAPTTVANGTITLGAAGAATLLYTGNATSTDRVIALSNTNNGATLDQSGTGLLKFTSNMTTGSNSKTLTLQGSTSGTGEISGNIPNVSGGNLTVTKTGTGTWTLTGNNTYAGQTTVTVGTLLVSNSSGSATGTGSVSVQGGATLAGTGFIAPGGSNGLTVLSTGIIAPGITGTTGNLTINGSGTSGVAATFNLGAVFALDLNATTVVSDRLVLTNGAAGDFAFGGNTINFNILTGTIADGQTYILFSGTNANQFAGLTLDGGNFITAGLTIGNGLPGAFGANSNLQVVGNNIVLNAIPEPSTWALLALSLTTVMVLRRRRNS